MGIIAASMVHSSTRRRIEFSNQGFGNILGIIAVLSSSTLPYLISSFTLSSSRFCLGFNPPSVFCRLVKQTMQNTGSNYTGK